MAAVLLLTLLNSSCMEVPSSIASPAKLIISRKRSALSPATPMAFFTSSVFSFSPSNTFAEPSPPKSFMLWANRKKNSSGLVSKSALASSADIRICLANASTLVPATLIKREYPLEAISASIPDSSNAAPKPKVCAIVGLSALGNCPIRVAKSDIFSSLAVPLAPSSFSAEPIAFSASP